MKYAAEKYPRISVITVVHNRARTMERTIKSCLSQNYPNLEYMVLDAASTDGTVEIINKYRDKIDYYRSHKDNGPAEAINEGIDNSTGEIIALLNSDDFFEPNALITIAEAFIENPEMEMINFRGNVIKILPDGQMVITFTTPLEDLRFEKSRLNKLCTIFRFYKKSLYIKYGKYTELVEGRKSFADDYEHLMRLSIFGVKNMTIDFVGYNCEAHEGSSSFNTSKYTKLLANYDKVYYLEQLFSTYEADIEPAFKKILWREYKKAYPRRVVKHLVDKKYSAAWESFKLGLKKFGPIFPFSVIRFWISYSIR